ncbi:MAG: hypothetical protein RJB66_335 [Pseudomonadota bacterium]|jgi:phosphoserine phosphatase
MVSVIIPSFNHAWALSELIPRFKTIPLVSEVIIIDQGSTDQAIDTDSNLGALTLLSPMPNLGSCLAEGVTAARNELVVYWHPEMRNPTPELIESLITPIEGDSVDFVSTYSTNLTDDTVTSFTVRPQVNICFPELSSVNEFFPKIFASRKSLLSKIKIDRNNAFTLGLLIDLKQLSIRTLEVGIQAHPENLIPTPHQELKSLAETCAKSLFERMAKFRRINSFLLSEAQDNEISKKTQPDYFSKVIKNQPILLIDLDHTVINGNLLLDLARYAGLETEARDVLENSKFNPGQKIIKFSKIMSGIPRYIFEKVAKSTPLRIKVPETILELKRLGYQVGLVSNGFLLPTEIIRERIYADFSIAHHLNFKKSLCTGSIVWSKLFSEDASPEITKSISINNIARNLRKTMPDDDVEIIHVKASTDTLNPSEDLTIHVGSTLSYDRPLPDGHLSIGTLSDLPELLRQEYSTFLSGSHLTTQ